MAEDSKEERPGKEEAEATEQAGTPDSETEGARQTEEAVDDAPGKATPKDAQADRSDGAHRIAADGGQDVDEGPQADGDDAAPDPDSEEDSESSGDDEEELKEDDADSGQPGQEAGDDAGKGGFGKKWTEKKAAKKAEAAKEAAYQERISALEDKVRRQLAEFDNFRKRTEKEKSSMFENGARSVIEKVLPVVDNFERGLSSMPEEEKGTPFAEGMQLIYRQLMTELDNIGVKPIEAVGKPFDPNYHNAVMQTQDEEHESGTVVCEMAKGYTYHDIVIRHSMVAVAK